jgi:hypothetical protein
MPSYTFPFFQWCDQSWLGTAVRDHVWAFPVIETFHLLALAVLLGTVLIVNLRVLGLGARFTSVPQIAQELERWMVWSIVVLIASGIPMMMSEPMKCYESTSFLVKMILLVLAIVFHSVVQRKWAKGSPADPPGRLAAFTSLALWSTISMAGKGIPYI